MNYSRIIGAVFAVCAGAVGFAAVHAAGNAAPTPSSPSYPPARIWQAMAGNDGVGATAGRVYMFGGDSAAGANMNDLWYYRLSSGQWTQLTPASRTQALYGRKLAALSCAEGSCALFGGVSTKLYNETWYFAEPSDTSSTVSWSRLSCNKTTVCPSPRHSALMAFDTSRHYRVTFGGVITNFVVAGDTWTLSGTRWTRRTPINQPSPRSGGSATFVPSHTADARTITVNKVVIFGGTRGSGAADQPALCDLWAWNGSDWEAIAAPDPKPCLVSASSGWEASSARLVVAGGYSDEAMITPNTTTWYFRFNGPNSGTWSMAPATVCAPLPGARGAHDPANGKFVFFGGAYGPDFYADTLVCP